jgi:hypothetical protein
MKSAYAVGLVFPIKPSDPPNQTPRTLTHITSSLHITHALHTILLFHLKMSLTSIPINGISISYITHSPPTNPPAPLKWVVLVNGLADDKESWAYQVDDLTKAGYTVLAFDNRGVGGTSARKCL